MFLIYVTFGKLVIALIGVISIFGISTLTTQVLGTKFTASLSGDQVAPPTDTSINGTASFRTTAYDSVIKYKIKIGGSSDVSSAEIHLGKKGENGETVVDLLKDSKKNGIRLETSIRGNITSSELQGSLKGKLLVDLISAMKKGNAYVNIGTPYHDNAEMRGQILIVSTHNSTKVK